MSRYGNGLWTLKSAENIPISDMTTKHLRNTALYLIQKAYSSADKRSDEDKWAKANLLKAVEMLEVLILREEK